VIAAQTVIVDAGAVDITRLKVNGIRFKVALSFQKIEKVDRINPGETTNSPGFAEQAGFTRL